MSKSILILGDHGSGKRSLISRFPGVRSLSFRDKSLPVEYTYFSPSDDNQDDHTKLGIWMLTTESRHVCQLQFALAHASAIVLVASLETPWELLDTLTQSARLLTTTLKRVGGAACVAESIEADDSERILPPYTGPNKANTSAKLRLLGCDVPFIVVITKTDLMPKLELSFQYNDRHWDFIQCHIRNFCLSYGATLMYTSAFAISDTNCNLLANYLRHLCCGSSFTAADHPCASYRDQIFIPAGWDSEKKIAIVLSSVEISLNCINSPAFSSIIGPPVHEDRESSVGRSEETIAADTEDDFRKKLGLMLEELLPSPPVTSSSGNAFAAASVTLAGSSPKQESPRRRQSLEPLRKSVMITAAIRASTSISHVSAGSPVNKTVPNVCLTEFFRSLLEKKTVTDSQPGQLGSIAPNSSATQLPDRLHMDH